MIRVRSLMFVVLTVVASTAAAQPRDRTPPTAPANLRVTAFTSYSVSLAWSPSTDNSGSFSYRIQANGYPGGTVTVDRAKTMFTFTTSTGVTSGYKYSFSMWAVDAAGNKSKASNATPTVTLPADRNPPSAPVLSVTDVTPSTASLSWTPAQDDGPYVSYVVVVNGSQSVSAGGTTALTLNGLTPSTPYAFSVLGRDNWQNWSPASNEVRVTTSAPDASDATPPTVPSGLSAWDFGGPEPEVWLFWTQSTDNTDAPSVIKYEIFVNGRLDHFVIGRGTTVLYGDPNGVPNKFTIVAVDVAGNRSAAAAITCQQGTCQ